MKEIEWKVVCPECGHIQKYHSHNKFTEIKGKRRKECQKCERSFKPKDHRLENLPEVKKKLRKEKQEKGTGFHKYSKSDY